VIALITESVKDYIDPFQVVEVVKQFEKSSSSRGEFKARLLKAIDEKVEQQHLQ